MHHGYLVVIPSEARDLQLITHEGGRAALYRRVRLTWKSGAFAPRQAASRAALAAVV